VNFPGQSDACCQPHCVDNEKEACSSSLAGLTLFQLNKIIAIYFSTLKLYPSPHISA